MLQRGSRAPREPSREVSLRLSYADTWSWTKLAALISAAVATLQLLITIFGWNAVLNTGLLAPIDKILHDVTGDRSYSVAQAVSMTVVVRFAAPVAGLTFIVGSVLGPVCAILYNLAVGVAGGLTVRLANPR
jgi:hypothetical protein